VNDVTPIIIAFLALFQIYPILRMLNAWLVDRTINGRLAFFAVAIHLTAIFGLWGSGQMSYLLVYLSATSLLWVLSPFLTRFGEEAGMRRMRDDDMRRYQHLLEIDPRNAAAHAAAADINLERGRIDEAIAGYQRAIEAAPDHTQREQWLLQQALELRDRRRGRRRLTAATAPLSDTMLPRTPASAAPPAEETPLPPAETAGPEQREPVEAPPEPAWHWYDSPENER
jgi:tetratricopeptide (TPR) repeat protein